ncbi:hypothetical protein OUZ56_015323 [Daphnia magna]|uniref:Uncharacterized protein n=1 Tax=Daphnia magna TaxID=35525 RepID=A0ABR0AMG7_9CRUS|nr:hypothetical protein OUZ56_015323 [Daphnia magna]
MYTQLRFASLNYYAEIWKTESSSLCGTAPNLIAGAHLTDVARHCRQHLRPLFIFPLTAHTKDDTNQCAALCMYIESQVNRVTID